MPEMNPINRLYTDIITILNSLTIKIASKADEYETLDSKSAGARYIRALSGMDTFNMYDDYNADDMINSGITDPELIKDYINNRFDIPVSYRDKLLFFRRQRELTTFVEKNNYYRCLYGLPDIEDTDFIFLDKDTCALYSIPEDLPIHMIQDTMGDFYISAIISNGIVDKLKEQYPTKKYLNYLGSKRIPIQLSRQSKNFQILAVNQEDVMESTYREFVRSYEKSRIYFTSTSYIYELKSVIPYYDNFIALCIFVMAIQQVSMRAIANAREREFYDEYMVRLLYETYGVPYFSRADKETQKLIVQNINLLIQNKATNKVIIDIASLLGFNDISIYQYYLVKKQLFDPKGRPVISKKKKVNQNTGKVEEVYDYESMNSVRFQKVNIDEENIKEALTDPKNKVDYNRLVYYDPYWWEDDELHSEIWEKEYSYAETKYMGITIPYRLSDVLFESIILLRMILSQKDVYGNVCIQIPKITSESISIVDAVILYLAMMSKKLHVKGQILSTPSKIIHALETIGQEINKEDEHIEVLSFNFDAFKPENIEKTKSIIEPYLTRREYRVVNGHDVDLNEDGSQNTSGPTKKVAYTNNTRALDAFYKYLNKLSTTSGASKGEKAAALNEIYKDIRAIYEFLSYEMSQTNNKEEYYALNTFYKAAFYTQEISDIFNIDTDEGERPATTFEEYFLYTNIELYSFLQDVKDDELYLYIDHLIYKMEEVSKEFGGLYSTNEGFSPLMQLLELLVNFFKSYRLDFVDMTSLLIVDWEMENTFRFFSHPQFIKKINVANDRFGSEFMDLVSKYITRYSIKDRIKLSEYIRSWAKLHVEDKFLFTDMHEYVRSIKVNAINDAFSQYDTVKDYHASIVGNDNINLTDVCVKKIK